MTPFFSFSSLTLSYLILSLLTFLLSFESIHSLGESPNVVTLTTTNFDDYIDGSKPALVEFYASWCGHCKTLAPIYDQLGDSFSHAKDKVVIAKIDTDIHKEIGSKFGIQGFPTLKWFPKGSTEPEDYTGGRTFDDLNAFINEKTSLSGKVKKTPTFVTVLDEANFDSIVHDADKDVLVEFYAPWCGHCKTLAPIYEKVAKSFASDSNCVVANLNADSASALAGKYGVTGYPSLKFFPKGSSDKTPSDYEAGRDEESLMEFLNEKCGTKRVAGGGFLPDMGLIESFSETVTEFMESSDVKARKVLATQIKKLAQVTENAQNKYAAYYGKVMDKILKNKEYAVKELTRLEKIALGSAITPEKLDDFHIRKNILNLFVSITGQKAEEVEGKDEL